MTNFSLPNFSQSKEGPDGGGRKGTEFKYRVLGTHESTVCYVCIWIEIFQARISTAATKFALLKSKFIHRTYKAFTKEKEMLTDVSACGQQYQGPQITAMDS